MWWWIGHVLGLDDPSGPWYLFYSGVCANLSLLGGALVIVRKHQCHVRRCWRLGRHDAGSFVVCRVHSPHVGDSAPTAADVHAHVEAQR